ncbi:hypothetical protein D3C72_1397650 [compost metagenome]
MKQGGAEAVAGAGRVACRNGVGDTHIVAVPAVVDGGLARAVGQGEVPKAVAAELQRRLPDLLQAETRKVGLRADHDIGRARGGRSQGKLRDHQLSGSQRADDVVTQPSAVDVEGLALDRGGDGEAAADAFLTRQDRPFAIGFEQDVGTVRLAVRCADMREVVVPGAQHVEGPASVAVVAQCRYQAHRAAEIHQPPRGVIAAAAEADPAFRPGDSCARAQRRLQPPDAVVVDVADDDDGGCGGCGQIGHALRSPF